MSKGVEKIIIIFIDLCLAVYIGFAFFAFRSTDEGQECKGVSIVVADGATRGFIDKQEVLSRLEKAQLNPKGKALSALSCREIEETLAATPFISTAQCYTTIDGIAHIEITQRMPLVRVMASDNDDFYIDEKDCVMPLSNFTSDIIIATGKINRTFATEYIAPLTRALAANAFSRRLFVQINITDDGGVELIPQVGSSVIFLGQLPKSSDKRERERLVGDYVEQKMGMLEAFYKYGLPAAGWNRYSIINLSYSNQVVCKKRS